MESDVSLFLSALCCLSPQVIEWVSYGTLQLLSDFADFHREELVCKVLHLSLASERTDLIKIFQVCAKYISAYMQSEGCGWREKDCHNSPLKISALEKRINVNFFFFKLIN